MKRTAALRYPTPKAPGSPIVRHTGAAQVAISSDGRVLASAGADGWLHVVELEVGRLAFSVDLGAPITALALTASSVIAAVGSEVRLVNGLAGRAQAPVKLDGPALALAVSHDGAAYAALDVAGQVVVLRTLTGRRTFAARVAGACSLAFSPDDRSLRLGGADGTLCTVPIGGGAPVLAAADAGASAAPVVRLRDDALQVGGRVLATGGAFLAENAITFDAIEGRCVVGDIRGWRVAGEGSRGESGPVVDLALHPGLNHAAIVLADGAVELVLLDPA